MKPAALFARVGSPEDCKAGKALGTTRTCQAAVAASLTAKTSGVAFIYTGV
jgi:hypothetical protein